MTYESDVTLFMSIKSIYICKYKLLKSYIVYIHLKPYFWGINTHVIKSPYDPDNITLVKMITLVTLKVYYMVPALGCEYIDN